MSREFGRRFAPDQRDQAYQMRPRLLGITAPRPTRYWRTPGNVIDQVGGSCVGAAWTHFLQSAPKMTKQAPSNYLALYKAAQLIDEWPETPPEEGTSVRAGAKMLVSIGMLADEYLWAWNEPTVRDWILTKGPVVLGIDWHADMMEPDREGFVHPAGGVVGGHAILCYGYSHKRNAYRLLQSWGDSWGQDGRCWIGARDLDLLLGHAGEACAATEIVS
jgi:papain like protease